MATLISHIFNEEYLLPFWLEYHSKIFTHGIIIDYNSTDNSVEIIKKICPTWEIRQSRNIEFKAEDVDREVMDIEATISGYKIALNTTEFLIPNASLESILCEQIYSVQVLVVARTDVDNVLSTREFISNFTQFNPIWRRNNRRYIHNYSHGNYDIGRHHTFYNNLTETDKMFIVWTGFYPWNKHMIKRKVQIQTRIPISDKLIGAGHSHICDEQKSRHEAYELMKNKVYVNNFSIDYVMSLFEPKSVLIIGGNGYIGSSLNEYLKPFYNVDIMDISLRENKYVMDYKDITREIINKYETIVLLAGNSSVKNSVNMESTYKNNISNFIHLLSLITTQKLIYASSASVYGSLNIPATEDMNLCKPHNFYDLTKQVIDLLAELSGKNIYGLRLGTVNGVSPNFRIDLMLNSMVNNAINDREIYICSKDSKRAILAMYDLNKAIKTIIEKGNESNTGIYNLCSFNSTVESMASHVSYLLGACIIDLDKDTLVNSNITINKSTYNFILDNQKFRNTFDFEFNDNIEILILHITDYMNKIVQNKCIRNIDFYQGYLWDVKEKLTCRTCNKYSIECILDLGSQPLANSFHKIDEILKSYPLKLMLCKECYHLQLSHVINPNILYKNYIYVSGTSATLIKYFEWFANYTIKESNSDKLQDRIVLEIACNDGSQLDEYKKLGWTTIGVDPAENIYKMSSTRGHKIYCDYWSENVANDIRKNHKHVDIIIAENVFGHTEDIYSFLKNCKKVMDENSLLFIQTSQANMVRNNEYDTVYHEHLSFFSIISMNTVVQMNGLFLNNVTKTNIHGVSFVFEISTVNNPKNINEMINEEKTFGIQSYEFYIKYKNKCIEKTEKLRDNLFSAKKRGFTIVGYGSSAKGNTILNFINERNLIDYIVDDNKMKHGLYTPGMNIQVLNPSVLEEETNKKIAILMLTWNFKDEIIRKINAMNLDAKIEYIYF